MMLTEADVAAYRRDGVLVVPVRRPLPPALRQESLYENQLASDHTYFRRVA